MSITPEQTLAVQEADPERERDAECPAQTESDDLVVEDLLVEDVSIDGMCGVY
jgi:mycofactocin precursor